MGGFTRASQSIDTTYWLTCQVKCECFGGRLRLVVSLLVSCLGAFSVLATSPLTGREPIRSLHATTT